MVRMWSGTLLRQHRESAGLTQEELARLIPTSVTNISRWERGRNRPGANMVAALADVLSQEQGAFFENGQEAA